MNLDTEGERGGGRRYEDGGPDVTDLGSEISSSWRDAWERSRGRKGRSSRDAQGPQVFGRGRPQHVFPGYGPSQPTSGPHTGKGPKNYQRSDERIVEDSNRALERHPHVDASEIEVAAHDGVVTLSGKVADRWTKRAAEECVERISGVTDVMNGLQVDRAFFARP